jgi:hypothetical protein
MTFAVVHRQLAAVIVELSRMLQLEAIRRYKLLIAEDTNSIYQEEDTIRKKIEIKFMNIIP